MRASSLHRFVLRCNVKLLKIATKKAHRRNRQAGNFGSHL